MEQCARALAPRDGAARVLMSNLYASSGQWHSVLGTRAGMKEGGVTRRPGMTTIEIGGTVHGFVVTNIGKAESKN